ncbi:MAG TPA: BrnT family toxin [Hyphomicrobiales bacterium]|nr:BrnT family toxin [Hyphomicrobiales bacterium]
MDELFEWDEDKRLDNIAEHGVDFRLAALVFESPVLEAEDRRADYGERRYRALGRVDDEYFLVAFTWRGDRRRIISAWKVGEDGKRRYQAILGG